MTSHRTTNSGLPDAYRYFVVSANEVIPLNDLVTHSSLPSLQRIIAQEVRAEGRERVPQRVMELLKILGFEWEPISDHGHMRFLPWAASMMEYAKAHACGVANRIADQLEVPLLRIDGVNIVDSSSSSTMKDYLALIQAEPGLYGERPYRLIDGSPELLLRQTGCIQKFSVCKDWRLTRQSFPLGLFEISDSYRREPVNSLQLCFRVSRFRLPEAHIHAPTLHDSLLLSSAIHGSIMAEINNVADDWGVLVTATSRFASSQRGFIQELAVAAERPVLLKVYPPGRLCQDGVEVDVEYKVIDSLGCPRELATFQIDHRMTQAVGLTYRDERGRRVAPWTIHAVFTGSLERYIYLALDHIAAAEGRGESTRLPLWLAPVVARVIMVSPETADEALRVIRELWGRGVRADVDDRVCDPAIKIRDADVALIPFQIIVEPNRRNATSVLRLREYRSERVSEWDLPSLLVKMDEEQRDTDQAPLGADWRLSRRPVSTSVT